MSVESEKTGGTVDSLGSPTMLDETTDEDTAEQQIDEQFICFICHEKYKDPRILSCLHVSCLSCLQTLVCSDGKCMKYQNGIYILI